MNSSATELSGTRPPVMQCRWMFQESDEGDPARSLSQRSVISAAYLVAVVIIVGLLATARFGGSLRSVITGSWRRAIVIRARAVVTWSRRRSVVIGAGTIIARRRRRSRPNRRAAQRADDAADQGAAGFAGRRRADQSAGSSAQKRAVSRVDARIGRIATRQRQRHRRRCGKMDPSIHSQLRLYVTQTAGERSDSDHSGSSPKAPLEKAQGNELAVNFRLICGRRQATARQSEVLSVYAPPSKNAVKAVRNCIAHPSTRADRPVSL